MKEKQKELREYFGHSFINQKYDIKEKLEKKGLKNIIKFIKEHSLEDYNLKYVCHLMYISKKERDIELNYERIKGEFSNSFFNLKKEEKDKLSKISIEVIKEEIENGFTLKEISEFKSLKNEKYKREDILFRKYFSREFSQLKKDCRDELIKYGFEYINEFIKENDLKDYYLSSIYYDFLGLNEKEINERKEFIEFKEKYGSNFSNIRDNEKLIELGFSKVQEIIKENNLKNLKIKEINKILNKEGDLLKNINYYKFLKKYGVGIRSMKKEKLEDLLSIGFEEFNNRTKNIKGNLNEKYNKLNYGEEIDEFVKEKENRRKIRELKKQYRKELGFFIDNEQTLIIRDNGGIEKLESFIKENELEGSNFGKIIYCFNDNNDENLFYTKFSNEFSKLNKEKKDFFIEFGFQNLLLFKKENSLNSKSLKELYDVGLDSESLNNYRIKEYLKEKYGRFIKRNYDFELIYLYGKEDFESFIEFNKIQELEVRNILRLYGISKLKGVSNEKSGFFKIKTCGHYQEMNEDVIQRYKNNGEKEDFFCTECFPIKSACSFQEKELLKFIKSIYKGKVETNKKILNQDGTGRRKEIDIFLPELNIGFEYNGIYWHQDDKQHYWKINQSRDQGIKLIIVWEDLWLNKKEIIKHRIRNVLKANEKKIGARKIKIKEIGSKEKNQFLENYHLMGRDNSKVKLGAYYNEELVGVMTFSRPNKSKGGGDFDYELNRFATKYSIIGLGSKFMKYFSKNYDWKKIISFSDNQWGDGEFYEKLGFSFDYETAIDFCYLDRKMIRHHRFSLRKDVMIKKFKDEGLEYEGKTGDELVKEYGYLKIYGGGHKRFSLKKN